MRLFLSCNIPEKIASYLQSLAEQIRSLKFKESERTDSSEHVQQFVTLTIPKQFDLTMKFFGDVSETVYEELKPRLESIRFPCFNAALQNIQVFDERRVRIIWVGVTPKEPFFELHKQVENVVNSLFPQDTRFSPHITLARVKSLHNRKAFLEKLQKIEVEPLNFSIDRLILFQSTTAQSGAIHTPLLTVQLGQGLSSIP